TLLPLNGEANYLAHQHENRVGFLSIATTAGRSPLPRERFSPSVVKTHSHFADVDKHLHLIVNDSKGSCSSHKACDWRASALAELRAKNDRQVSDLYATRASRHTSKHSSGARLLEPVPHSQPEPDLQRPARIAGSNRRTAGQIRKLAVSGN
ncbi:hypothetical protein VSR82_31610, partial [Burkholderia sp. JPY481]